MQISQYIVIKKTGTYAARYSSRITKGSPALASNEVAVKVLIELPDNIFERLALQAKIIVPNEALSQPVITAEVKDNVQEIIKQNTGFDVRLEVIEPEQQK